MAATYPADTFQEGVELTIEASNQLAQVVRGDANTEVMVADGSTIPSIRKAQADSMYFKEPEAWTTGQTETDYLQLKKYINPVTSKESWWFAKGAMVSNPIAMGTSPFGDDNWTLYTPEDLFISGKAEYESVYQALKGKAAEAGYNLVRGSFEEGGTLTNTNDVLWYQSNGKYYNWFDSSAKTVVAGSTPSSTGGISSTAWVDRTDVTLRSEINIVQKRFACVADMVADTSLSVNQIVETISYYAGWVATTLGPIGGARYVLMSSSAYNLFIGNELGANDASNGHGLVDHILYSGIVAVLMSDENGRINVQKCGAIPDMNTSDASGTDSAGTNVHPNFIAAISRGVGVNVPAGDYRIHGEINLTTDAGGLYGAGWFKSRLWYTQTEGSGACVKINNENNTLSNIGICNGVNVSAAESRTNLGILQESGGNLGLDSVYLSGFGYGAKISNYFANRIVVEFCKQVGIWDFSGRKSNLQNVTMAACRVPLRVGDGTNNTQCQDKAYSNITLEATATSTAWQTAYEPLIDIVGKSAHTQWNNIRLINPYGAAVRINNAYSDGGTVYSESCHEFSNIKVRNNRNMTGYTNQPCFDITASSDVIINGLNTHQPVLSTSYGFDSAVYVRDTLSRVKVNNSSIGGSLLSIGSDSIKGYTSLCSVTNTEYNVGGVTFNCGNTQEDGHTTTFGNKSGTVNLTLDFGRTISMVVTGAITMSTIVNNANVGDRVRLIFIQDAIGGYAISFNSAKWKASLAAASGAANTRMTVEFQYDGTYMVQIGASSPWM